jgi:ParB family chromosome partitioning protein
VARRRALGKGLEALISTTVEPGPSLSEISVESIVPNPHQPRQTLDPTALQELADSIREHGLIQPLIVTQQGQEYQLIAGERRWEAAKIAGLERVPAMIKDATPQQMLELALVENIQRADLNPLEEAGAYQQLIDDFGLTQAQVAERVGKSRAAVANSVRLLRLPGEVKESLALGQIREGHARALLGLPDEDAQRLALKQVIQRGFNVRQTESLVRGRITPPSEPRVERSRSPETNYLERAFSEALSTKVRLIRSRRGGRLIIHFYSEEELEVLHELIVNQP